MEMSSSYDDSQFTKDFIKLNKFLFQKLKEAKTSEDARSALDMIEGLASHVNSPSEAKTMYGLAYLMKDKPWYDFEKGFSAIKEAAESDKPFCWFILGSLYLDVEPGLPQDPVLAKYWIEKAADAGYSDAAIIQELQWGDNPEGFVDWLGNRFEKERKWMRWIGIGGIVLIVIVAVFLICRLL